MLSRAKEFLARHPRAEWLIPAALCLLMLSQMLLSVRQMSQHADEATHLYAGYRVLKCGDYTFGREHPPLAKMLAAAPLLWSNPPIDCVNPEPGEDEEAKATNWLYSQDNWWPLLMQARVASSLSALLLCLGVWLTARKMFGRAVALVSTALLAFEPNILGHGPLVLNNVLLAALFLLTIFCFYLWTRTRSEPMLLVATGFFFGLTLLTKYSAVMLVPLLILLAIGEAWIEKSNPAERARRTLRNFAAGVAILAVAAATIWCGFGVRYSGGTRPGSVAEEHGTAPADVRVLEAMRSAHLLPKDYLDGLIDVRTMVMSESGVVDILGRPYRQAPWFFIPVAAAIKFTASFLIMLAMGGAGFILMGRERRKEFAFLLIPALLFLAASTCVQRTAIGIWHVFPMFPFLIIAAAAGCVYLARRHRWASGALMCLLVLHAVSSLRSYPNYLSYANELWGGPKNLYKLLPVTDTGQAYWEIAQYMEQHPNTPCWLDSDWRIPADKYKVPCTQMGNHWEEELPERMKGIVFISSSWLQVDGHPGSPLASFYDLPPKALLGGSG